jgi:hypothetical protein
VEGADVLAVEMEGQALVEGHDRERRLYGRLHRPAEDRAALLQALADVRVGDDRRELGEGRVAPRVVAVPVGVEDEAHGLLAELPERGLDLRDEGRVLVVHDHDPVLPDRGPDVPARTLQHPRRAGHLGRLDLHLAPVALLGGQWTRGEGDGHGHELPRHSQAPFRRCA